MVLSRLLGYDVSPFEKVEVDELDETSVPTSPEAASTSSSVTSEPPSIIEDQLPPERSDTIDSKSSTDSGTSQATESQAGGQQSQETNSSGETVKPENTKGKEKANEEEEVDELDEFDESDERGEKEEMEMEAMHTADDAPIPVTTSPPLWAPQDATSGKRRACFIELSEPL